LERGRGGRKVSEGLSKVREIQKGSKTKKKGVEGELKRVTKNLSKINIKA